MLYSAANPEDESQHLLFHNQFISAVKYVVRGGFLVLLVLLSVLPPVSQHSLIWAKHRCIYEYASITPSMCGVV